MKTIAMLLGLVASAPGSECPEPPVVTEAHAICVAKGFAEKHELPWKLEYTASEEPDAWHVIYAPVGSARGGSGEIKIQKASAKITIVRLNR